MVKKRVGSLAVSTIISMTMPGISTGIDFQIKQERYLHQMPFTQDVYAETFVISSNLKLVEPLTSAQQTNAPNAVSLPALFTNPIVAHFAINSTKLQLGEAEAIITQLRDLNMPGTLSWVVTGFTCQKGSDRFNKRLSTERARVVAELLRQEGFNVGKIEGRGSADPVSEDDYPVNRRVEITAHKI